MHLIIPMAGKGTRMRPHTLTTPKPLMPIAGKSIVERLVEEIKTATTMPITTIGYVVHEMPDPSLKDTLVHIAQQIGAQARFYVQATAQGTAHAIYCAAELLEGPIIVAFADTLFKCTTPLTLNQENTIWVKQVANPSAFGVVAVTEDNQITAFVEKPSTPISDLAIIGIYYFRQGALLREALEKLVAQPLRVGTEYLLTDALQTMMENNVPFSAQPVEEWFDCGNKNATLHTNQCFLTLLEGKEVLIAPSAELKNSVLVPPVYLGENVQLENAIIGPYVSIGAHTRVVDARIQHSLVQRHSTIEQVIIQNSIIGNQVHFKGNSAVVNIGDYTTVE